MISRRAPSRLPEAPRRSTDPAVDAHFAHARTDGVWWLSSGPRVLLFEWARVAAYR